MLLLLTLSLLALHFHIYIANDSSITNPKTPSGLSYEDAEFAYEHLLDPDRDRELRRLLPKHLRQDICFPREQAVKFYKYVFEGLHDKREPMDDDEESEDEVEEVEAKEGED